jgi:hypothetical protein
MAFIYSGLALAEIIVLIASACAVLFLVVRGIVRSLAKRGDETKRVPKENLQHLKRAGQSGW